jgi:hypothetical protein
MPTGVGVTAGTSLATGVKACIVDATIVDTSSEGEAGSLVPNGKLHASAASINPIKPAKGKIFFCIYSSLIQTTYGDTESMLHVSAM